MLVMLVTVSSKEGGGVVPLGTRTKTGAAEAGAEASTRLSP